MATQGKVHFLDITSSLTGPSKSWSPNTLRTRMVLNYKGVPYTQSFVSYPDIEPLLKPRSVPVQTTTTMPYTLPAIIHPESIKSNFSGTINDSWPIALHLDELYTAPEYPPLFPSGRASHALAVVVQKIITAMVKKSRRIILPKVPAMLDERGAEHYYATRNGAFGIPLDELLATGEELEKEWKGMFEDVDVFVNMLRGHQGKEETAGPFFEGDKPGYADFLLVSFLAWCERTDKADWQKLMSAGDGELMKLWEACLPWVNGQGEEKSIDSIPKP